MIPRFKFLQHDLPLVILIASLLGIYLATLAPGLTWADAGGDGGDLIAAAAAGGVAHPTGYPLYLLLARLFQALPVGSLAFRTNLMSALAAALAGGLVYKLVVHYLEISGKFRFWPAGLAAGFAFGLAPVVWSQAVITEVYALQGLLTAAILYMYTRTGGQKAVDSWRGLLLGLAMGNHMTTLLLVPAALLLGSVQRQTGGAPRAAHVHFGGLDFDAGALARQLAGLGAGLLLYLTLPLRALGQPPVNWGNAVTPGRLWWLISGELYRSDYLQIRLVLPVDRLQAGAALLVEQFGLAGILIGIVGLVVYGSRTRLHLLTAWMAGSSLAFAALYLPEDSYVYLIPLFISFAVWIGLGLGQLAHAGSFQNGKLGWLLVLAVVAYVLGRGIYHWPEVDASHDLRAENFGSAVLERAPRDAIVFATGDQAVFAMWYFHYARRERTDLVIVASGLLHYDWYQETLRSVYPSLDLAEPFPWPATVAAANPDRPVCYVEYVDDAVIDCAEPGDFD